MNLKNLDNQKRKKIWYTLLIMFITGVAVVICIVIWMYFATADSNERGKIENTSQIEIVENMKLYIQDGVNENDKIQFSTVKIYNEKVYFVNSDYNICTLDISTNEATVKKKLRIEKFAIYNDTIYYLNRNGDQYDLFSMSMNFDNSYRIREMLGDKENDWYLINGEIFYSSRGKGFCKYNLKTDKETVITTRTVFDFQKVGIYYFIKSPDKFGAFLYIVDENGYNRKIINNHIDSFYVYDNTLYFTNNKKMFSLAFDNNQAIQMAELASNKVFPIKNSMIYIKNSDMITEMNLLSGNQNDVFDATEYDDYEVQGNSYGVILICLYSKQENESTIILFDNGSMSQQSSITVSGEPEIFFEDRYTVIKQNGIEAYDENLILKAYYMQ